MIWRRDLLVIAYERAAAHWAGSARLYQALAKSSSEPDRRAILQALSDQATRRVDGYDRRLERLHVHRLHDEDS